MRMGRYRNDWDSNNFLEYLGAVIVVIIAILFAIGLVWYNCMMVDKYGVEYLNPRARIIIIKKE